MKLFLEKSGGFAYIPGLDKPIAVDTQALDPKVAQRLMNLVQRVNFFSLSSSTILPSGAADYFSYKLNIQDGAREHTVTLTDPISNADLSQLIDELQRTAP